MILFINNHTKPPISCPFIGDASTHMNLRYDMLNTIMKSFDERMGSVSLGKLLSIPENHTGEISASTKPSKQSSANIGSRTKGLDE
jgi:hypothetical protein